MKRIFLSAIVFTMLVMLAVSAVAAEPGDYGYYDRDFDGKVEVTDVLDILKQIVNDEADTSILRVIQTLKIVTAGEVVTIPIKALDYDTNTATLLYSKGGDDYELTMSFSQLGLDREANMAFFEEGFAKLTVPSPSAEFLTAFDSKQVYAAKIEGRYETDILELTVDNQIAKLNGVEATLFATPIMSGDVVMIAASDVRDFLGADVSWDGTTSTAYFKTDEVSLEMTLGESVAIVNGVETVADAPLVIVDSRTYVPAKFVAVTLGANVTWDEEAQTMTIMRQFYPTVYLDSISGAAGEDVTVTAYIKHNPGIAGLEFKISYDSSVMSYVSGKSENGNFYIATSSTAGANPVKVVAANLSLKNISGDLKIATITFKIADEAVSGSYLLDAIDFKAYDSNIIELNVKMESSTLTID
ncbi:MAG: hypothetical protein IJC91_04905 [Oscillospiraceae bacterium]|nr:hypothetical protein [Oscillospiraceae bacterium]